MNNVCLVGRLTRDPELRTTSGGLATTTFSLAVDSGRRDETGRSSADFITCVAWRNQAENLCKYLAYLSIFASSNAASISSRKQNGIGFIFNIEKRIAIAVMVFSPPLNNEILVMAFPGG